MLTIASWGLESRCPKLGKGLLLNKNLIYLKLFTLSVIIANEIHMISVESKLFRLNKVRYLPQIGFIAE